MYIVSSLVVYAYISVYLCVSIVAIVLLIITLNKSKSGGPFDICPIAVGGALRRFTGKCVCAMVKGKAIDSFHLFQYGVACPFGAEKIAPGLRACIDEHWGEGDFTVSKMDMRNAFNVVSWQSLLSECNAFSQSC